MGNLFSNVENVEEEIHEFSEIEDAERFTKEVLEISEEVIERVIIDVVEEIAVTEIENKIHGCKLECIKESVPHNSSPTHYSNLKYQLDEMPVESNELKSYKSSPLTKYYNLYEEKPKSMTVSKYVSYNNSFNFYC